MKTPIMLSTLTTTGPSVSATRYTALVQGPTAQHAWNANDNAQSRSPMPVAGTLSNLRVQFPVAPGAGTSYAITIMKGGVAQSLTCTISDTNTTAADISNTVAVSAGDLVNVRCVPTNTPAANTNVQISMQFEATTSGQSPIFAAHGSQSTAGFTPLGGAYFNATETTAQCVMPTAGAIDALYIGLSAAPGAGTSKIFTLRKNNADSALAVTIADAATTGSTVGTSVSYVAGDIISVSVTVSGAAAASTAQISLRWLPTTTGESLLFHHYQGALSTSADRFTAINGTTANSQATESNTHAIAPVAFVVRKTYGLLSTAPGSGKSRTFTLMAGAIGATSAQSLAAAVVDTATTAQDVTNSYSAAVADLLAIRHSPSGTPAGVTWQTASSVAYIAPATSSTSYNSLLLGVG
jgi:hypothetical protein